jgi:threonine dehydrogenase-like Zn-dependent dehydrogenase
MKRIGKLAGVGNIVVEEAPRPEPGPREVLVRTARSLISRGSEIGRRYLRAEAIDPAIMGYSAAGMVEQVGAAVTEYAPGDRVAVVAPHAEYVLGDVDREDGSWVMRLPEALSFEQAAFLPLATGAVMWAEISGASANETVVVLGQGLVGSLVMQAARARRPRRIIAVDALPARCELAERLGADVVVNAGVVDPVRAVLELTGGEGAEVVIDCVGGRAGVRSFEQALEMSRAFGRLHLIALYHDAPLPLDSGKIQRRLLIGGYYTRASRRPAAEQALAMLADGRFRVAPLITHRFPYTAAKQAYDLLAERPGEALGVIFAWD